MLRHGLRLTSDALASSWSRGDRDAVHEACLIINGDCLDEMKKMEDNSVSCIVTDPPYGLGFMGKEWDAGLPHNEIWKEALRIVKPGGHLLAFGGTRTYHRLTSAIEDSGFEIRDCLMWIYGSGFPKSHNHFGIDGYGTALKPAYEPIIMAMKPCDGTFANNVEKWGQAGINIDACRIGEEVRLNPPAHNDDRKLWRMNQGNEGKACKGRWPANILFDEEAAQMLDEQSGIEASRFFYCAKTSSKERNEGLEGMPDKENCFGKESLKGMNSNATAKSGLREYLPKKNNHPTVKPLKLMRYLITLVMPPKDGVLLDPFAGSGSTIVAAHQLGLKAIGIEKQPEYCEIARRRLENVQLIAKEKDAQLDLFKEGAVHEACVINSLTIIEKECPYCIKVFRYVLESDLEEKICPHCRQKVRVK